MSRIDFPHGRHRAVINDAWSLSFDDLHRIRYLVRAQLSKHVDARAIRIVGCLNDDETSLFALLFVTELFDYMPINPNLSDVEITQVVKQSGATAAILSANVLQDKRHLFDVPKVINWDELIATVLHMLKQEKTAPEDTFDDQQGRLILHTSGSTGLPKRVPISIEAINASAKHIAQGHHLTRDDHALNALPTFHIGALVDVLLAPLSVNGAVSVTDQRTPAKLADQIIAKRPTWVQIVPTILRRMVEDLDPAIIRDAGASLKFIRSISAPVPADLKHMAEELFGCPIVEMYGMTETAGQIATNVRDQSSVKPGSVGQPVSIDVAILDAFGNRVANGKDGEICVKGPTVFDGYEGMAKEDVFFDDWFRTGDLGMLDNDGYLFLRGRLKEMINAGGEKISPHEIETAVLLMPDVIEAAAYSLPHPTMGEQVGLTVATRGTVSTQNITEFLETQLASFKCPNSITILDHLPRLANAKVDRVLLKRDGERAWADRNASKPAPMTQKMSAEAKAVRTHWVRILKCRAPEGQDDFFDMGGDSLSATQLLLDLEKALGQNISSSQLFESPTFDGLVASLQITDEHPPKTEDRALRFVRQNMAGWPGSVAVSGGLMRGIGSLKSGTPLFWACQSRREIQAISDTFGKQRPFYFSGSLYRFRNRKPYHFAILADQLAMEINTIQPHGPISLGGYCGGAWMMHHAADKLRQMGRDIRVFISFDYWPDREVLFPTVHGMSQCRTNSALANYAQYDLAMHMIHPNGAQVFEVESTHRFEVADLEPHLAILNAALDGTGPAADVRPITSDQWGMDARLDPPRAKIKVLKAPRFYQKGATRMFHIALENTSQKTWGPTNISGLSIQIDLMNIDNRFRTACAGFASFDQPISPGEEVELNFDLTFPYKTVPLWITCRLVSQGLVRFKSKHSGARKILVLPNIFSMRKKQV